MTQEERPALCALADHVGIMPEYVDQTGTETRVTSHATRERLLQAFGHDASSEHAARAALDDLRRIERARLLAPVQVVRASALRDAPVRLALPDGVDGEVRLEWELVADDGVASDTGARHAGTLAVRPHAGHPAWLPLPADLAPGYFRLHVRASWRGGACTGEQRLIVAPDACWTPPGHAPGVAGLTANLYTVRSGENWGIGNVADLRTLLALTARLGGAFVGVNPLHALFNRGTEVSPYSPVSRLHRNPLYLDVAAIPELRDSDEAGALLADPAFRAELTAVRGADHVQYERIAALQRPLLALLHRRFAERERDRPTPRGLAYAAFRVREGQSLDDYATFRALDDHVTARAGAPRWWREWPEEWRDARSAAVARFREENAEAVDLHRWVQFELDVQLAAAAHAGREAGLAVGLYQDLAVGSSGGGSDVWAQPGLFVYGVSQGAPPDPLGPEGQDWGFPPLNPHRLAADGYRYWIQLVRAAFRHAGALRVDHVLGLVRQFWIPWGTSGADGAYVRFPTDDLLGVLALESVRHEALVVGEDLGTVPPEVPPTLRRWRVLSSKVMLFERQRDGGFAPSAGYAADALATVNTHDLPTLAGWWMGRDVELRERLGRISPDDVTRERAARARERVQLLQRLRAEGCLGDAATRDAATGDEAGNGERPASAALRGATHRFLRRTPSMLVGLALDDLAGEVDPVNVPGTTEDEYPSWTRRMRRTLEELVAAPDVREAIGDDAAAP